MTPLSPQQTPDAQAPGAVPDQQPPEENGVEPAVEDFVDPTERGTIPGSPVRALGATGVLDCKIWSVDFRERLEEGDPLRVGFVKPPEDGTAAGVERLTKLHNAALLVTTIDR
jgi:hypothetical protein